MFEAPKQSPKGPEPLKPKPLNPKPNPNLTGISLASASPGRKAREVRAVFRGAMHL